MQGVEAGQTPLRDVALLAVLYSTGVTGNEAAKLTVSDYVMVDGSTRVDSVLRAEIAFNGKARPLIRVNRKMRAALDDYLSHRSEMRQGVSTAPAAYRGLAPHSPLTPKYVGDGQSVFLGKQAGSGCRVVH
jgi:site-specific recombinase XerD